MPERSTGAEYFETVGLRGLNALEEAAVSSHYGQELIAGLAGLPSSVRMFPSHLKPVSIRELPENSEALVIEIGGTNLYGARIKVQDQKPAVLASHEDDLPTTHFENAQDFYETLIKSLEPILTGQTPQALAIVYSFPGEAVPKPNGVGVISPEKLPKEFVIPGISRVEVGEAFLETLGKTHPIKTDIPTVVLNDTVAVLFSAEAPIGGVVGTGYNLAISTPKGIINSESGGFAIEPTHQLARAIDEKSSNPGKQLVEKQISGLYLGEQMKLIALQLSQTGVKVPFPIDEISSETITYLLQLENTDSDTVLLQEAAGRLRDRSAQIVGVMIATAIRSFPEQFPQNRIRIPMEGSPFWKVPGYSARAKEAAERLSQKRIDFLNVENAGRIGAAVAALSFVKK